MNRVRELVGASYAYDLGYDGKGIGVAVLDSGERAALLSGQQEPGKIKDSGWFDSTKKAGFKSYFQAG